MHGIHMVYPHKYTSRPHLDGIDVCRTMQTEIKKERWVIGDACAVVTVWKGQCS